MVGEKVIADHYKEMIIPSLKTKDRLKLDQDGAIHNVKEKRKPWCKLSYKLFEEKYGYDPLLDIYPFPTLIQLKYFIGGIEHCVTFLLDEFLIEIFRLRSLSLMRILNTVALIKTNIYALMATEDYWKPLVFFKIDKISVIFRSKKSEIMFDAIKITWKEKNTF